MRNTNRIRSGSAALWTCLSRCPQLQKQCGMSLSSSVLRNSQGRAVLRSKTILQKKQYYSTAAFNTSTSSLKSKAAKIGLLLVGIVGSTLAYQRYYIHTEESKEKSICHNPSSSSSYSGPGFRTPKEAMEKGPREKLLYIPFLPVNSECPQYLAVIDVDPQSPSYLKVIHRIFTQPGEELHHTGWNSCSSCHGDPSKQRRFLIIPALSTGNIYIIDTQNERKPRIHKILYGDDIKRDFKLSWPHTAHCLGSGEIMISYIGNESESNSGGFLLLDEHFAPKARWEKEGNVTQFGYDFWYQPYHNVMVSSGWGNPQKIQQGFNPAEVASDYGKEIFVWDWTKREIVQKIDLGSKGLLPLEVRFLHDPKKAIGFVGAALSSNIIRFWKDPNAKSNNNNNNNNNNEWKWEVAIEVPAKDVEGWALPSMPSLITDFVISLDDKYLYLSNWLHGDVRQYDISNPEKPKLVGQVFIGGSIRKTGTVKEKNVPPSKLPDLIKFNGEEVEGGPQMIQLSLDGKRLYVTTSLYSVWDKQFYPNLTKKGGVILQIEVDNVKGGLKVNKDFIVDLSKEPFGPVLSHEVRYPGGDCTSDIWLAKDEKK